ncbi:MAG: UDP-N-acetylglucosamine 2-epimerase (non-hydrolyzing) [Candidatus Woesearchaeota archaeon]
MKIITILGTRPEITKLSPLLPLLDREFDHLLIHTGQHYDYNMDRVFFNELGLRKPDYMLNVGSATQAKQTAEMMVKIEEILIKEKPDSVIVFADPNTPLAGALVAAKLNISLIHLEAGCRSFNKKMPEEINRILCDHCADLLIAPDMKARQNLLNEGLSEEKIHVVGSTAIESSLRNVVYARENSTLVNDIKFKKEEFILATIHRAENTNDIGVLKGVVFAFNQISEKFPMVFPLHPRTKKILLENNLQLSNNIKIIEPQGYLNFLNLLDNCLFVMSDSGGIQEEAAALNTPCLILRNETEWTYLTDAGKNILVGTEKEKIISVVENLLKNREEITKMKNVQLDLNTNVAEKIVEVIKDESKR